MSDVWPRRGTWARAKLINSAFLLRFAHIRILGRIHGLFLFEPRASSNCCLKRITRLGRRRGGSRRTAGCGRSWNQIYRVQMQLQLKLELEHFCELFSHYEQIRFIVEQTWQRRRTKRSFHSGESKRRQRTNRGLRWHKSSPSPSPSLSLARVKGKGKTATQHFPSAVVLCVCPPVLPSACLVMSRRNGENFLPALPLLGKL